MKTLPVLNKILQARAENRKLLALLIDPDKPNKQQLKGLVDEAHEAEADLIFVGGSLLIKDELETCLRQVKKYSNLPVVLFPGSVLQISDQADALLFLSLISGRNPELLIGNHVIAAPYLKQLNLEVMPTGYMLIDSGVPTTASYMSGSQPIPGHKPEIAASTAMAGELLGMKLIYMDAGSGAQNPISKELIEAVRNNIEAPLIVGGGIKTAAKAVENCKAGADVIVIGNATETNPAILRDISRAIKQL